MSVTIPAWLRNRILILSSNPPLSEKMPVMQKVYYYNNPRKLNLSSISRCWAIVTVAKKTMIIIFEETNLFINFRATSSGSNCSKNIYTTDFNNKNVSPEYDSALPETNETDNKSSRTSCVMEDNYSLRADGVYDVATHNQGVTGHKRNQITETIYSVKPEGVYDLATTNQGLVGSRHLGDDVDNNYGYSVKAEGVYDSANQMQGSTEVKHVCDDIDNNYGYSVKHEGVYDSANQNPGFTHTKTLYDDVQNNYGYSITPEGVYDTANKNQ